MTRNRDDTCDLCSATSQLASLRECWRCGEMACEECREDAKEGYVICAACREVVDEGIAADMAMLVLCEEGER